MELQEELSQSDVIHPDTYAAAGYPHAAWRRLREQAPVCRIELPDYDPFWAVTTHAAIVEISKQPDLFASAPRMSLMANSVRPPELVRGDPNYKSMLRTLLNMDNPDHRRYRKLTSGWFTPRAIARLATRIDEIVADLLAAIPTQGDSGECDFVPDFAARVPLRVIAEILGVPPEDEDLVLKLSNQGIGAQDPEFRREGSSVNEARRAVLIELFTYFSDLVEKRRKEPKDDLATVLAQAELDGEPLPTLELLSYFGLIAVAGHETTRNATSGGLAAFLDHPEQWQRLADNPDLLPRAVEEILRWTSPVVHFVRSPKRDAEVAGARVPARDPMVLFYPSANRDEKVFAAADEFRIDRDPNPHIAFGIGEHLCLGAHLARLELTSIFRQLLRRFRRVESAGPRSYLASSFVGGIKHLPIGFEVRT